MNRPDAPQMLPSSGEAEQAVLGGLMVGGRRALDEVADVITAEDFYHHNHGLIFNAILELSEAKKPFDAVTLSDRTDNDGGAYLIGLARNTGSAANIRAYAEIVRDKAQLRRVIDAGAQIQNMGFSPGAGVSVVEVIGHAQSIVGGLLSGQPCDAEPLDVALQDAYTEILTFHERGGGMDGLATGFPELDELTHGLRPGLWVLAGRPKMGKTTLAQNIAEYVALVKKLPVHIVSIEMGTKAIAKRMIASVGDVDAERIRTGQMEDVEWAGVSSAMRKLRGAPITIAKPDDARVEQVCAQIRKQHAKRPLGLVVVDYLQLFATPMRNKSDNQSQAIGRITRALALLAQETGLAILLVSQLNRDLETRPNKRPRPSDLRDSGSIEQDAEGVIFVYRDEVYDDKSEYHGTAEIILALHRNGPPGMIRLRFRGDRNRFETLPFGWEPERREKPTRKGGKTSSKFDGKAQATGNDE